jgi:hypothetical protein
MIKSNEIFIQVLAPNAKLLIQQKIESTSHGTLKPAH